MPGTDRWEVVIFDPGGVVPVKSLTALDSGSAKALGLNLGIVGDSAEVTARRVQSNFDELVQQVRDGKLPPVALRGAIEPGVIDRARLGIGKKDGVPVALEGTRIDTRLQIVKDDELNKLFLDRRNQALDDVPEYKALLKEQQAMDQEFKALQASVESETKALNAGRGGRGRGRGKSSVKEKALAVKDKDRAAMRYITNILGRSAQKTKCAELREHIENGADDPEILELFNDLCQQEEGA